MTSRDLFDRCYAEFELPESLRHRGQRRGAGAIDRPQELAESVRLADQGDRRGIKKLKQTLPGVDIDKGLVDKSRRTEAAGLERDGFTDVYFPQNFAARTIVGVAGPTFFPDMRCFPSARLRGITRDR
jgi:hypothetical protein